MAGGGGGKEEGGREREWEAPLVYVFALPATALPAVISRLEAAVPRKVRSCLPRAAPSAWWSYRIPVLPPPPAKNPAEEKVRPPRPQRVRVAPFPDPATAALAKKPTEEEVRPPRPKRQLVAPSLDPVTASNAKKPAKRSRRCLHCDAAETPQWRSGPMGRSTLCNACGVRYRAVGALREHRPAAGPVAEPPPESPTAESPPESPIWEPEVSPAIYLVRKPSMLRRAPRKEAAPAPPPPPPQRRRSCLHCGSMETPQWREGPMGRGTLCNACGVRYRQGRLLPEYRPIGSPTFVLSEHANTHRRVLELRRHQQSKDPHPHPPPVDSHTDPPIADDHLTDAPGWADDHPTDAPGCTDDHPTDSVINLPIADDQPNDAPGCTDDPIDVPTSLDSLLLDGPSAPLIVDGDEFLD